MLEVATGATRRIPYTQCVELSGRVSRACPEEESKVCSFGGSLQWPGGRGWQCLRGHEVPTR
jgi:hypothetical protein